MLAQNFKTATDLGITDAELDALIKVLGMLERNELVDTDWRTVSIPNGFNMAVTDHKTDCGTVGCIMGWCRFIGGKEVFNIFGDSGRVLPANLDALFMFGDSRRFNVDISRAATALRSYLTTGEANWAEALASA